MSTLTIAIVTLNRRDEILALLRDLDAMSGAPDEIIVVDNGSSDGTAEAVRRGHAGVRVIRFESNRGAPAGRNAAVAAASGEIVAFLDDDARVDDELFARRVRSAFAEEADAGLVAFRILDPATGTPRRFEIPARQKDRADTRFETSVFIAAGFAVRRRDWLAVGGMDESLIYGFEELDFGYRAVARGVGVVYRPEIRILHVMSAGARPSWRAVYYYTRNKLWISVRYLPWRMVLTQAVVWTGHGLRESLRIGRPDVLVAALAAALVGLPERLRQRRHDRLPPAALDRLRRLDGRLWT